MQLQRAEGAGCAIVRHSRIVPVPLVLPQDNILDAYCLYCLQHVDLVGPDLVGGGAVDLQRWLHGDQAEHLHEVVLDDVPNYTVTVEVSSPPVRPERLRERSERVLVSVVAQKRNSSCSSLLLGLPPSHLLER